MSVLKNVLSQWYRYLLWALMSVFFWGWIFGLLTDARPEKKLVLCVDRPEIAEEALSEELERRRPEGIKLVAAHSFDYYIFDTEELRLADLYIVGENEAEKYIESFLPLEETGLPTEGRALWTYEGRAYGLLVFDPAEDVRASRRRSRRSATISSSARNRRTGRTGRPSAWRRSCLTCPEEGTK